MESRVIMVFSRIIVEVHAGKATIALNRPDVLNAIDRQMAQEIKTALEEWEGNPAVRVVVVKGQGRAFCTGADLRYLRSLMNDARSLGNYIHSLNCAFNALEVSRMPVIASVHGYALAGGVELLLACDLVVTSRDSFIGDQHVNLSLIPGAGGSQRLPRKIGETRARELLLTGRWLTGEEAKDWGLVNEAVPPAALESTTSELAARLLTKSPVAVSRIKRLLRQRFQGELGGGMAFERETFLQHTQSTDVIEALDRFLKGRPANRSQ